MQKIDTHKLVLCALFTALCAVLSQIAIPIGPVPISLATFAVFLTGAVLGAKYGALCLAVYAALGAAGAPVFAMFRAGVGALAGPTGGYILGYIPAACVTGLITEKWNKGNKTHMYYAAMLSGMLAYYLLGTAWYMFSTNTALTAALAICVFPFIPGDIAKIAVATVLAKRLRATRSYNNAR